MVKKKTTTKKTLAPKASAKKTVAKKASTEKLPAKELEKYRALLIQKWHEIAGDANSIEENIFQGSGDLSSLPMHMADVGTDSFEQEFGLNLLAEEKKILAEIQRALKRIDEGDFGICEGLDIPIEKKRLEAIPWTRYSLKYAEQLENGQNGSKWRNLKSQPLDVDREDDIEDEEEEEEEEVEDPDNKVDFEEGMESLDALEEEEEEEEDQRGT